jgi:hypothetical protein
MYTIVFLDRRSPISTDDEYIWRMKLKEINGSIAFIDYAKSIEEEASDNQNTNNEIDSGNISIGRSNPKCVESLFDVVYI